MVLVRQSTESLRSWQTVCDLAISPPSCAMAMALPLRLLLPWTPARVLALSPAADAAMPNAEASPLGLLLTAPAPKVEAELPPTAAVPALPAAALPCCARAGVARVKTKARGRRVFIFHSYCDRHRNRNIPCGSRVNRRRPPPMNRRAKW